MTNGVRNVSSFMEPMDQVIDIWEVVRVTAQEETGRWSVDLCPKFTEEMVAQGIIKADTTSSVEIAWHQTLPFVTIFDHVAIETATLKDFSVLATYLTTKINTIGAADHVSKVGIDFDSEVGMIVSFSITVFMPLSAANSDDKMEMLKIQFQALLARIMVEIMHGTIVMSRMFAGVN